eukprot:TRINITY_DN55920_c0_g1_i1.p1 TRINITY_DN55920_c0_g1~~TRINITY_DN55920_c0_g1_i1.p1  ORF type:complete len:109 (+),score=12.49 TRINITY_DN55920_c0_g1_i1:157-483(+)
MLASMSPAPVNWRLVAQTVDEMMYYSDKNKDGKISWSEFRADPLRRLALGWLETMAQALTQRLAAKRVSGASGVVGGLIQGYGRKYGGARAPVEQREVPSRFTRYRSY